MDVKNAERRRETINTIMPFIDKRLALKTVGIYLIGQVESKNQNLLKRIYTD